MPNPETSTLSNVTENADERIRRTVVINGRNISYLDAGEGWPVLLLHGIGSAARSWVDQIEQLARTYRVVAWDAPGYGGSDALGSESPVAADYAELLGKFTHQLGLEQPVMLGHSLGALMAASYAGSRGKDVKALVLADPALGYGRADSELRKQKLDDRIAMFRQLGPVRLGRERGPNLLSGLASRTAIERVCEIMSQVREEGYLPASRMLAAGDLLADVSKYDGPALILCGAEDAITPPRDARKAASMMQGAVYREIPQAGHASYVEQPDVFTAEVETFLGKLGLTTSKNGRA